MSEERGSVNFIEQIVQHDISEGKHGGRVHTRFPPEPNGYLHIGHAKSIVLNFELAKKYNGLTNLRFDDTNPTKESDEYVQAIKKDIRWLGYDWGDREYYASDYFETLFEFAVKLIKSGKAYVDDSTQEEISRMRGVPTSPGTLSPYRNRTEEENLSLFMKMKEGAYKEGEKVLRAKIDMASPNMHMRDPIIYRILYTPHHRTGDKWCIYPMYDFAHGQSDSIEGITHSLCTLEFENHRPLYEWFIQALDIFPSRQIEFARLNLNYTVMSKRKLLNLVEEGHVDGWDDPRMPTISGLRRRGYTPASIRSFAERVGIAKRENVIDMALLEFSVREDLNKVAQRRMAVLDPVKLTIVNYPENQFEELAAENNPENEADGSRVLQFGRELYIEREDFMIDPPKKFFRLAPGQSVRLKHAFIITCTDFHTDPATGEISEIFCEYHPNSKSGEDNSGIKAKGTLHWVYAPVAKSAEVRLYDRLFEVPDPEGVEDMPYTNFLNANSLDIINIAKVEPALADAKEGEHFQFLRKGYFCLDKYSDGTKLIFNRTVTLKDTWAKMTDK